MRSVSVFCPNPSCFSPKLLELIGDDSRFNLSAIECSDDVLADLVHECDILLVRFNHVVDLKLALRPRTIICPTTNISHLKNLNGQKIYSLQGHREFLDTVCSAPEFCLHLILLLLKNSFCILNRFEHHSNYRAALLSNKSVGIVGLGRIGTKIAGYLQGLGCAISYYDPFVSELSLKRFCCIEDLLLSNEIIVLSLTSDDSTADLISEQLVDSGMLRDKCLVNVSRDNVFSLESAVAALENGSLGKFATDVFEMSDLKKLSELKIVTDLMECGRLVVTPHVAGMSSEDVEKCDLFVFDQFMRDFDESSFRD